MSYTTYDLNGLNRNPNDDATETDITPEQENLASVFRLMGTTLAALVHENIMSVQEARTMLGLDNA